MQERPLQLAGDKNAKIYRADRCLAFIVQLGRASASRSEHLRRRRRLSQRPSAHLRAACQYWQEDADRLTAWYSGWYNGLAKKHYMDVRKGKEAEHEVIVYCKAHPELKIIQAIDVVFKSMRERLGITVKQ